MKKDVLIWVISSVSLLLSVIAVCVAVWRSPELGFDYQGVIIGVLSLLVTVLIGWNIYTLIDLKKLQGDYREIISGTSKHINGNMAIAEGANFMIYHYLITGKDPLGLEYRLIHHGIASIVNASQYGDIPACNNFTDAILQCVPHPENIVIRENEKNELLKLISLVKNGDKIKDFLMLIRMVALLNVRNINQ